ncbi:uncharacterized protein NESG_01407 [Nematocida ausubeli]|uniref:Uncharacterized protein n=1 Tax=Nematocida ausubeli (strain ATCC PRA-371 / ERTm2) TaxID=1913371 RepID=A0A086J2B9_NEMA1|nr:uncharacterized protein NESG_01407 [Nematocida ausubeli]KFG26287.1 hypothetical protein NESG_01407 [Nematocida ausubeli]
MDKGKDKKREKVVQKEKKEEKKERDSRNTKEYSSSEGEYETHKNSKGSMDKKSKDVRSSKGSKDSMGSKEDKNSMDKKKSKDGKNKSSKEDKSSKSSKEDKDSKKDKKDESVKKSKDDKNSKSSKDDKDKDKDTKDKSSKDSKDKKDSKSSKDDENVKKSSKEDVSSDDDTASDDQSNNTEPEGEGEGEDKDKDKDKDKGEDEGEKTKSSEKTKSNGKNDKTKNIPEERKIISEKEIQLEKVDGSHLISEKILQDNANILKGKESMENNKKSVYISIRNNVESGTVKSISEDLLRHKDKEFGTSLLEKSKSKFQVDFKKLEKEKKESSKSESLKRVSRAEQIVERISLYYSRNKDFTTKVDTLVKTVRKLSTETIQKIFLNILHKSDSPYVVLYVLSRLKDGPVFLSDECIVELSLFVRSCRSIYLETIPYTEIIKNLFEKCILPDVTVEHSYDLLSQIEQTEGTRDLLIELFGRVHIVNYYKEVTAGLFTRNIQRSVLYTIMHTINDKTLVETSLSPVFKRLDKNITENTVEKNTVIFSRGIWAFLHMHMDGFNERFDDTIKYIRYFCTAFTNTSCEFLSADDVLEIIDTIEILANSVINRTIHSGEKSKKNHQKKLKNYVEKKVIKKKTKASIIPEMEDVEYSEDSDSDESAQESDETEKSEDSHPETNERLNNVKITQESLLIFTTMLNKEYKTVYEKVKEAIKWKKRPTYDTLLYAMAHIKLLHLLLYLSKVSGSVEIPINDHYSLFSNINIPASFDGKKYDGTEDLADRIFSEKWNSLGFLLKEGLITSNELNFSKDILRHKSPHQLFDKISASAHLLTFPPVSVFLENGHLYDVIFLQTLPMYVRHKDFLSTLQKIVRTFIGTAEKEALALLTRRLIELDGLYTEKELKRGSKKPNDPNHYTPVKSIVRNTIASLFITEIDLSCTSGVSLTADSRKTDSYDRVDVQLHETKEYNPVTKQEEYKVSEEIVFKRVGTDMHKELKNARTYHKSSKEGKNVDEKRRKMIFDFIISIKDMKITDRFITALTKLPSAASIDDKMKVFIIRVLTYAMDKALLTDKTIEIIRDFSKKELKESSSQVVIDAAKYLYIKTSGASKKRHKSRVLSYDELTLSLLLFISSRLGDLSTMKDGFFKICADLKEYQRNELLLLFKEAGVQISDSLAGTSEVLERYNESKKTLAGFPSL